MKEIVTAEWLYDHRNDDDLIILDASISPVGKTDSEQQSLTTIDGALIFDLKSTFLDKKSPFPNAIPSPPIFEEECQALGINQKSTIVVFDNRGIYSSPRVWWLFHVMGHNNIAILDGGLPAWLANDYPTTDHYSIRAKGNFKSSYTALYIKSYTDTLRNVSLDEFKIIDARSEGRFLGIADEPRKNLKSGHIPNSVNIPYSSVLSDGHFKSKSALASLFDSKLNLDDTLVFSCGSGMTACIVLLASRLADRKDMYLYDGSWTEWAIKQGLTYASDNDH